MLRDLLSHRHAARDRLRRSLWVSFLVHVVLFVCAVPLALPTPEPPSSSPPQVVEIFRVDVPSPLRERSLQPEPEPEPEEPKPDPQSERSTERLEFVRSHLGASEQAPDTQRISTQNQQVAAERWVRARSQVADGAAHRGHQAGNPQRAARAGAKPQQPSTQRSADASAQQRAAERPATVAGTRDEHSGRPTDDPCQGDAARTESCRALALASPSGSASPAASEREGWDPIATRLTGVQPDARPFDAAPRPDMPAPTLDGAADASVRDGQPRPSRQLAAKESRDSGKKRPRQARAERDRETKPERGSAEEASAPRASRADQQPQPEPELRFLIDPVQLAREERERQANKSPKEQRNRKRRLVPPGTASPAVASTAGSEAAAGGSVVSPIERPPVLDVRTALSTRKHPLAVMLQSLDDQLREAWEIPFEIRTSGIVGTTGVEFLIDRRGRVRDIIVVRPSGHPQLDALAAQAVPQRLDDFRELLDQDSARDVFPEQGLRVTYQFAYTDSPVAGIL